MDFYVSLNVTNFNTELTGHVPLFLFAQHVNLVLISENSIPYKFHDNATSLLPSLPFSWDRDMYI